MQARHNNYELYFKESEQSCKKHYFPYLSKFVNFSTKRPLKVLEVGCGLGGNVALFSRMGCMVKGVDINKRSIERAIEIFEKEGLNGEFVHADIHEYVDAERYDLIILHDAIEHIHKKEKLMGRLHGMLSEQGILYVAFPAWCMPFGGHQQVARTWFVSRCPFIHLLPEWIFLRLLRWQGESENVIKEFMEIKKTRMSIQAFQKLCRATDFHILDRKLYFINPHYEVKFGLTPRVLWKVISSIPFVRDFFTTSCHYLIRRKC